MCRIGPRGGSGACRTLAAAGSRRAGYIGFAIGRTLWWEAIKGYLAGSLDRPAAARAIADMYSRAIDVYATTTKAVLDPTGG